MISQAELIKITKWKKGTLWRFCHHATKNKGHYDAVAYLMGLRRDIQKAIKTYAKGRQFDAVQLKAIEYCEHIVKWCGEWFKPWAEKEILKLKPELYSRRQKLKGLVNQKWEVFVRRHSY